MLKPLLSLLFTVFTLIYGHAQNNTKGLTPSWVKSVAIPQPDSSLNGGGMQYLLFTKQVNFAVSERFYRQAMLLESSDMVSSYSDISISYDPFYQSITFNAINIYRGKDVIDKLATHTVKVFQRESNMERSMYDGHMTAVVNLSDVRKGDILEYSYTISGSNPSFPNHFYSYQNFEFSVPTGKILYRVLKPKVQSIECSLKNTTKKPNLSKIDNLDVYEWDLSNVKAFTYADNYPSWYEGAGSVSFSNYSNWGEVVNAVLPFYKENSADINYLKSVIAKFKKEHPDERIMQAIRFVQDDIRYLGFENGLNAFKPHKVKQVYNQRFGDCKDKSFLLLNLLKAMGYKAFPVLINSYLREGLDDLAVSPYDFDHVVVKLIYGNNEIYIDPTYSNQGGDLYNLTFPDYGKGLVLKAGNKKLDLIKNTSQAETNVLEDLIVPAHKDSSGIFEVNTEYSGVSADNMRSYFLNQDLASIQEDYLNYYSNIYEYISPLDQVQFLDDREKNVLKTYEKYRIDSIWNKENGYREINTYPAQLRDISSVSREVNRKQPYYLNYPSKTKHETKITLPEIWDVTPENSSISGNAYAYSYQVEYNDQYAKPFILVTHKYETKVNHVKAEDFEKFLNDHDEIYNNLVFQLTYPDTELSKTNNGVLKTVAILLLILFWFGSLILFSLLAVKVYKKFDPTPERWAFKSNKRIGSWLFLPLLGLIVSIPLLFYNLFGDKVYYSINTWVLYLDASSAYYSPGVVFALGFEIVGHSLLLITAILCLVLFLKRRSSLPKLMVAFYAINLVFVFLDLLICFIFLPETEVFDAETRKVITRGIFGACLWIPVFLTSSRVKETFVKTRKTIEYPEFQSETATSIETVEQKNKP